MAVLAAYALAAEELDMAYTARRQAGEAQGLTGFALSDWCYRPEAEQWDGWPTGDPSNPGLPESLHEELCNLFNDGDAIRVEFLAAFRAIKNAKNGE